MKKLNLNVIVCLSFVMLIASCTLLETEGTQESENNTGIATIGVTGGIITVNDKNSVLNGVEINVPEGALDSDVKISIHEVDTSFALKKLEPNSFWIKLEPAGTTFNKPIKIGIPFKDMNPDDICMYWSNGTDDGGEVPLLELDKNKKMYFGALDHFTYFGLTSIFGGASMQLTQDSRDDKYYLAKRVGEQWWFMNDAAYDIPGSRVYNDVDSMAKKYGRLYNYEMALKACPSGWHLPSKKDFEELEMEMGMSASEIQKIDGIRTQSNVTGNLTYMGVLGYLQGSYSDKVGYAGFGSYTGYWTSTASYNEYVWSYAVYEGTWFFVPYDDTPKSDFVSVKCVK